MREWDKYVSEKVNKRVNELKSVKWERMRGQKGFKNPFY